MEMESGVFEDGTESLNMIYMMQCTTSTLRNTPLVMLKVLQRFDTHCNCHFWLRKTGDWKIFEDQVAVKRGHEMVSILHVWDRRRWKTFYHLQCIEK